LAQKLAIHDKGGESPTDFLKEIQCATLLGMQIDTTKDKMCATLLGKAGKQKKENRTLLCENAKTRCRDHPQTLITATEKKRSGNQLSIWDPSHFYLMQIQGTYRVGK
jgi:hypothetical protein